MAILNFQKPDKIILQKAAKTLLKDSADCLEIANSQQDLADKTRALSKEQRKNSAAPSALILFAS